MQDSSNDNNQPVNTTERVTPVENEELARVEAETEATAPTQNPSPVDPVVNQQQFDRTNAALAKEKKKRRSQPGLVLLLCLLMAILGGVAAVALYKAFFEPNTTITQTNSTVATTSTSTKSDTTASTLITTLKTKLKGTAVSTKLNSTGVAVTTTGELAAYQTPYYQPDTYSFSTSPTTSYGVTTASANQDTITTDLATIRAYLADKGLHATAGTIADDQSSNEFYNDSAICTISATTYAYSEGKYQANVGCADITSYTETATTIKPLYTVYAEAKKGTSELNTGLLLYTPVIADSKTADYKTAQVQVGNLYGIGGSVALFYQTADNTWRYFTNTQNDLECSAYNTNDLKKAYLGTTCLDSNGKESAVSL